MRRTLAALAALVSVGALVGGCADRPAATPAPTFGPALPGDFGGSGPGTLVSANALEHLDPDLAAKTSVAARVVYLSTSGISDTQVKVSGTVFVPNGAPPPGGWLLVVLGHPNTGSETPCAPSLSPTLRGLAPTVETFLDAGYVVAVPDYQGLGLDDAPHPFLDSTTAGYNVLDAVRAAGKLVPGLAGRWVGYGTGQGGQAVWAANELAADYGGSTQLAGVVAAAPTAAVEGLADAAAAGTLTEEQMLTLHQYLSALANEYTDFRIDDYRHGVLKANWDALSGCVGGSSAERARVLAEMTAADLRPSTPDAVDALRGYLKKTALPQGPTAAPMLVTADRPGGLIPQVWTDRAVARACELGDIVATGIQAEGDPDKAVGWITDRFNSIAAQNDCPR
ncbi:lipase family protein [Mycolicibacterium sp. 120266]|uniref:lipase family protein n=1 Tax=Mycolicibacterium sp. 120266 TaxID=3090601 RepID=UPI00299D3A58|nr:lipase family protein [Mycolicibacterium sp. 120266]MDX1872423.1 lipase family protein [Mycolicibacterium sp. 120266]